MKRCIVTYAEGAHEELLDISLPRYKEFALRHGYDCEVGTKINADVPPAWNKIHLLLNLFNNEDYDEVVWFDCDLVIVNQDNDFPPLEKMHSLVRHFEKGSEVPNSGVWRLKCGMDIVSLLHKILDLEVFLNHGWWEQAALMTLMGYTVPPQGSRFLDTKCRCVQPTRWYRKCQFMRVQWNSHPNYKADNPRIVHCSYPDMSQRIEVMKALMKDPHYDYPSYKIGDDDEEEETQP